MAYSSPNFVILILNTGKVVREPYPKYVIRSDTEYVIICEYYKTTHKGYLKYKYKLCNKKGKGIKNRTLIWGKGSSKITCKIPPQDEWVILVKPNGRGLAFSVLINNELKVNFKSEEHGTHLFQELMDFLIHFKSLNPEVES